MFIIPPPILRPRPLPRKEPVVRPSFQEEFWDDSDDYEDYDDEDETENA